MIGKEEGEILTNPSRPICQTTKQGNLNIAEVLRGLRYADEEKSS